MVRRDAGAGLPTAPPTHVFLHCGVGTMAAGLVGLWENRPVTRESYGRAGPAACWWPAAGGPAGSGEGDLTPGDCGVAGGGPSWAVVVEAHCRQDVTRGAVPQRPSRTVPAVTPRGRGRYRSAAGWCRVTAPPTRARPVGLGRTWIFVVNRKARRRPRSPRARRASGAEALLPSRMRRPRRTCGEWGPDRSVGRFRGRTRSS
jgi:hypothetical protein